MKVEFKRFHKYIHVYKVKNLYELLGSYQEELYKEALDFESNNPNKDVENFSPQNREIHINLNKIFNKILRKYYIAGSTPDLNPGIGVYFQNNSISKNYYHNHYYNRSLVATTYLNPPLEGEGGEISFYINENKIINILPQPNLIYFFPGWLLHKPLPQKSTTPRFCFNWGYNGHKKPIHKITGDRW